jgi:hypothetical protein
MKIIVGSDHTVAKPAAGTSSGEGISSAHEWASSYRPRLIMWLAT